MNDFLFFFFPDFPEWAKWVNWAISIVFIFEILDTIGERPFMPFVKSFSDRKEEPFERPFSRKSAKS